MIQCILLDEVIIYIHSLKEINEKGIGEQIIALNCNNNHLKTLEGLENCVNLQRLYCDHNELKTLEGLENCVNLQRLLLYKSIGNIRRIR